MRRSGRRRGPKFVSCQKGGVVRAHDVGDLELRFGVLGREFPADLGGEPIAGHENRGVDDVGRACRGELERLSVASGAVL